MTARNDWVAHLRQYPLKELRQRQNICRLQIEVAYKAKNERALTELNNMYDSLIETSMINEFYS